MSLYFEQSLLLKTPEHLKGVAAGKFTLLRNRHYLQPSWELFLVSSQKWRGTARFLTVKHLLGRLKLDEALVLFSLAAESVDLLEILLWRKRVGNIETAAAKGDSSLLRARNLCRRIHSGTSSLDLFAFKRWNPVITLEERRIGVGYKDKGSLSSAPSWKDQIFFTEEEPVSEDDVLHELKVLLSFSEFLTSGETSG